MIIIFLKEDGKMIKLKDMGYIIIMMEIDMKENIKITNIKNSYKYYFLNE